MADKVKNMRPHAAHGLGDGSSGSVFDKLHLGPFLANQLGQRLFDRARPAFGVDQGEVLWCSRHHEHAQRQVDGGRRGRRLHRQVAHHRRLGRNGQESIFLGVKEKLPGQGCQLRWVDGQPQPQRVAACPCAVEARSVRRGDAALQERIEQHGAEVEQKIFISAAAGDLRQHRLQSRRSGSRLQKPAASPAADWLTVTG